MRSLLAALAAAAALFAVALPADAAFPIHAVVLGGGNGMLVARTAGATGMLAAGTYRFAVDRGIAPAAGTEIDGLVDGRRAGVPHLTDVTAAQAFVAGLPSELRVHALREGDPLPGAAFVDQNGRRVALDAWRGKTTLLSFIYTRCPLLNVCPAVSAKFAWLQRRVDPARTHLALVTLDPVFDSPSVLARYGKTYETDASRWSLLTGEGHVVKSLLDRLSIAPLEDAPGNIIHEESLVIADDRGIIRRIIPTPDWDPNGVLAEVRTEQGLASNPFQRWWLAMMADVAAICGGQSVASFMVVVVATGITILIAGAIGGWFFWKLAFGEGAARKHG